MSHQVAINHFACKKIQISHCRIENIEAKHVKLFGAEMLNEQRPSNASGKMSQLTELFSDFYYENPLCENKLRINWTSTI